MIDINLVRTQPELVLQALSSRGLNSDLLAKVKEIDTNRKNVLLQVEEKRAAQNKISRDIKGKPNPEQIQAASEIKEVLKQLESQLKFVDDELNQALEAIPNIPAPDVPIGKDDSANIVIKTVGKIKDFDFTPKDHVELGKICDILDIEKSAQISGSRFGFYKNEAAVLELTVMWYVFTKLAKKGFHAMVPPYMIKHDTEWRMGYVSNKNLAGTYYYLPEDDLKFISSSEHSVGPYHMEEILALKDLPLKYVNFSPCFRREAGTYGKDMKGMLRVHCFNKVEMIVFTPPDFAISDAMCLEMLGNEEEILQEFGLSYQIIQVCTGDMPFPNRRQYDINTYFPGQNAYRETSSCSNCSDYQTRRLNTRAKTNEGLKYVHLLNATAVVDRVVLAILENHQQKDGSILMPKVLQPLLGFDIIKPKL